MCVPYPPFYEILLKSFKLTDGYEGYTSNNDNMFKDGFLCMAFKKISKMNRKHLLQGFGSGSACLCPVRIRIRAKKERKGIE